MIWYTYMALCADGSLYTGVTIDPGRRIAEHNLSDKLGSKYVRSRRPAKLVYLEKFKTRRKALQRELAIKKLKKSEKLKLVEEFKS